MGQRWLQPGGQDCGGALGAQWGEEEMRQSIGVQAAGEKLSWDQGQEGGEGVLPLGMGGRHEALTCPR